MWVLTEKEQLINLDRFYVVEVRGNQVVARSDDGISVISVVLCSCDHEVHGWEIIRHIADALENGVKLYDIRNAKFSVYTCGVCNQQFEVPRRGGKVHFRLYDVVCPDCWEAEQDEAAGGAAQ